MRGELPVCKRCCFCIPLRYGLLTWGYLKLMAGLLLSTALIITVRNLLEKLITHKYHYHVQQIIFISIVLAIVLIDVALTTVFVVGGHTKNVKLLRVYYIYNVVLWALTIILVLVCAFLVTPSLSPNRILTFSTWIIIIDFSSSFVNIIMQTYFLLLVRSEIMKLRSNCEFRFVNNAAEAECTMKYKGADYDKETANVYEKDTCAAGEQCQNKC